MNLTPISSTDLLRSRISEQAVRSGDNHTPIHAPCQLLSKAISVPLHPPAPVRSVEVGWQAISSVELPLNNGIDKCRQPYSQNPRVCTRLAFPALSFDHRALAELEPVSPVPFAERIPPPLKYPKHWLTQPRGQTRLPFIMIWKQFPMCEYLSVKGQFPSISKPNLRKKLYEQILLLARKRAISVPVRKGSFSLHQGCFPGFRRYMVWGDLLRYVEDFHAFVRKDTHCLVCQVIDHEPRGRISNQMEGLWISSAEVSSNIATEPP